MKFASLTGKQKSKLNKKYKRERKKHFGLLGYSGIEELHFRNAFLARNNIEL